VEVELSIWLETSVNRWDALDAEQPCTLKPLWHASLSASIIAVLLAHTHHVHTRPQQPGAPRTEAPLHPRRLALPHTVSCQSIAQAFEGHGWVAPIEDTNHSRSDKPPTHFIKSADELFLHHR
jgi:hypothetical protein